MSTPIRRALISVSDKAGLAEFGRFLAERGVEILSTGGSAQALRDSGVPVIEVAEYTGFPEIMDGRVKTLQPRIYGGLLAVRGATVLVACPVHSSETIRTSPCSPEPASAPPS